MTSNVREPELLQPLQPESLPPGSRAARPWFVVAAAIASAFAAVDPADAGFSVYVEVQAGASEYDYVSDETTADNSPPNLSFSQSDSQRGVSQSYIDSRQAGSGSAYASVAAIANPGGVHVAANVSSAASASPSRDSAGSAQTDAQASMADSFVLLVPSRPIGAPLTLEASWHTSGALLALFASGAAGTTNANAYSTWKADLALLPLGDEGFRASRDAGCQHDTVAQQCWGDDFGDGFASVPVTNGQLVTVSITARARAWGVSTQGGGAGSSSMNAFSNLADTVAWGGITSLRDVDDAEIAASDYTAVSADSGYDYRFAYAPEPSQLALFAAACAGLCAVARRRASSGR
jgi:hypothetical protein